MERIIEYAYAKLNLSLKVIGKKDGYHMLQMLNIPLDFYDILEFEFCGEDVVVSNTEIKNNIIYETIELFKTKYKLKEGVKVSLTKSIPIGSGLGGGSADASATLRGLNRLFGLNKSLDELEDLAKKLGSDTLFCLYNKPAYVYGRGDKVKFLSKNTEIRDILLILPNINVSTKKIFESYKLIDTKEEIEPLIQNYNESSIEFVNNLFNDLTSTTIHLYPKLKPLTKHFIMSGSGSTFFRINPSKKIIDEIKKSGYNYVIVKNTL